MRLFRTLIASLLAAALTLSVSAAFTPSVEFKDAPEVVVTTDAEGNAVAGAITDAEGNVLVTVPVEAITITPISTIAKEGTNPEVAAKLAEVKVELEAALGDKNSELLTEVAKAMENVPVENIVVSDIFTVTADEALTAALAVAVENGFALKISLISQNITKAEEASITIWQKSATTGEWVKVNFTVDENNVITLELKDIGEIVIFRDSAAKPATAKDAPKSPQTTPVKNP